MNYTKRGFTLIELLVVIAIIGILSSVVLASLNSARKKGRDARRIADVKQLQLALELYYDGQGEYPDATEFLATSGSGEAGGLVGNGYIATLPTDPSSGSVYHYLPVGTGDTSYALGTDLETAGHSALSSDVDQVSGTFDGGDSTGNDCIGTGTATYCYDVKP